MRMLPVLALALLIAACSPPAPQPAQTETPTAQTPAPANPDAALLAGDPMPGQWFFNSGGGSLSAGFGAPESEYLFLISCEASARRVSVMYETELVPDQETTLKIVTAAQTLEFAARSFNEGLPSVNATAQGGDPRFAVLSARQERIAVDVAGEVSVLPWDVSIARTLAACRG